MERSRIRGERGELDAFKIGAYFAAHAHGFLHDYGHDDV